jgi:hypothetical protein
MALIAAVGGLLACANDALRGVPCSSGRSCGPNETCVQGYCHPGADAGLAPGEAAPDAGTDAGPEDAGTDAGSVLLNIDPICADPDGGTVFPPANMLPDTVPANCLTGFEMNDFHSTWTIDAITDAGASPITLEVDIATYQAPDVILISAVDDGMSSELLLTCRMQTSTYGDPTHGLVAPPPDSIREFRLPLAAGTTSMTFDFTRATTPQYIRVLGLCDFNLVAPPGMGQKWRLVSSR